MAFPFKTGGDFYNCEAQRMRLHNLGANPTETATGLMYFNTGTSNLGKHAVVHDGTNFKALAFVDEIASNTAFTELTNRVLTIEKALGEDTANVIDTWEEIQNFLKDIDDNDANLMTMLNSKADKTQLEDYLPLSGGALTKTGAENIPLVLKTSSAITWLKFQTSDNNNRYLGVSNDNKFYFQYGGTSKTVIHSGNIGEYKAGGLAHSNGTVGATVDASGRILIPNDQFICGLGTNGTAYDMLRVTGTDELIIGDANIITQIRSNYLKLCYGSQNTIGLIINSSGNVLIGTTADSGYKLDVAGTGRFTGAVTMGSTLTVGGNILPNTNNAHSLGTSSYQWSHLYAVGATLSGTLGVTGATTLGSTLSVSGAATLSSAVTIKGDLVVEGNIIGKKEVSAGGAGQEGESGAGGGAEVISQTLTKGASSYTITNTIKRSDIAVSLYEWNASGNSWDMCLADISVTDSNIIVTFGSATTVNHKLVAVG